MFSGDGVADGCGVSVAGALVGLGVSVSAVGSVATRLGVAVDDATNVAVAVTGVTGVNVAVLVATLGTFSFCPV